jgi:hypothetical protein
VEVKILIKFIVNNKMNILTICKILFVLLLLLAIFIIFFNNSKNKSTYKKYEHGYNIADILNMPLLLDQKPSTETWSGGLPKETLDLFYDTYPNSIFGKYYELVSDLNINIIKTEPKIELLLKVLDTYPIKFSDYTDEKSLVIHLRLGDRGRLSQSYKNTIINTVRDLKPIKVILLFGLHSNKAHNNNNYYLENSKKDIENIKSIIEKYTNEVIITNNDADTDLIIMYNASHLLVHRGGYSALGALLCKGKVYFSNEYLHFKRTKNIRL